MKPAISLLVCDLDNTLYDWVTFFSAAFYAMVEEACRILDAPIDELLDDLQKVHQRHHNSEQPFALLETRAVLSKYPDLNRIELNEKLNSAFHSFNSVRHKTLRPYPSVIPTLASIQGTGCKIVGHTEATVVNAKFRLNKLGLTRFVSHLYALEHRGPGHPNPQQATGPAGFEKVRRLKLHQRKPDPEVLIQICDDVGVSPHETLYVGDSLASDIGMARDAGVHSAWAKYGTKYNPESWKKLVRITHWTAEDVSRAEKIKQKYGEVQPDVTLNESISELLDFFHFTDPLLRSSCTNSSLKP